MKYNDNGVWKELHVKATDTLPIGTEVDYNGDVIPDGWEEVTPTIESGSNENGNWIKFEDGTLIQTMYIELPSGSGIATTEYGVLNLGSYQWTFPIAFYTSERPKVSCGLFKWGTGAAIGTSVQPSYVSVVLRGLDAIPRTADVDVIISAIAIGRWK